jgi:hypothetical protein
VKAADRRRRQPCCCCCADNSRGLSLSQSAPRTGGKPPRRSRHELPSVVHGTGFLLTKPSRGKRRHHHRRRSVDGSCISERLKSPRPWRPRSGPQRAAKLEASSRIFHRDPHPTSRLILSELRSTELGGPWPANDGNRSVHQLLTFFKGTVASKFSPPVLSLQSHLEGEDAGLSTFASSLKWSSHFICSLCGCNSSLV